MRETWLHALKGIVTVRIRGGGQEAFVNRAVTAGLELRSVRRTSSGETVCEISVSDFFRLRPYLKETGCRVHVTARRGLPFWLDKLGRRKIFAAGMALFIVGIYLLSSLVWNIEVTGNRTLSDEQVLKAAENEGIFPFQWSFRLGDVDVMSKRIAAKLPGAAWVGVEKRGTKVIIQVVETTVPEPRTLYSPRHLIATQDAVVSDIMAEAGRPVVKKNSKVKRGDILISGTLGEGEHSLSVAAKGTVRGLVWHEYNIVSPLKRKTKVYTGERKVKWFAVIGGRSLQVGGFGGTPFQHYETVERQDQAVWRNWTLPLGRLKQSAMEFRFAVLTVTRKEAKAEGLLQAKADLLSKAGPEASVKAQNLLHEKTENGKVYMKVLFEVEQSIATELPLVQTQGE
jgi:similar to stage IV sporulation protein